MSLTYRMAHRNKAFCTHHSKIQHLPRSNAVHRCRQLLQEAIALRQAKLDRIKASTAEGKATDSRPNMRKKEDDRAGLQQEASEAVEPEAVEPKAVEPKAKRPKVALSHLGDEDG